MTFFLEVIDRTSLQRRIRHDGHRNVPVQTPEDFLLLTGLPFIRSLRGEIEEAFSFSPVLRSFGVLDPRNLPDAVGELQDYGKHDIQTLADFYAHPYPGIPADFESADAVVLEFGSFKSHLFVIS